MVGGALMCDFWDPGCLLSSAVGAAASKVTNSFLDELRKSAADMVTTALKTLGTFWLNIPSPNVGDGSAQNAGVAQSLQNNLGFFTLLAAVVGLILCGARVGLTAKSDAAAEGVKMLARLIGVTAAGGAVVALLISAGDAFSPWVIEQSTGATFAQTAPSLVTNVALLQLTPLLTIVSAVFAVLGAAAMVIYMIIRGGLLVVLMAIWPLAASMSATEQGLQWYKKVNAWMVAFVLLKPVAAIIYSAGFLLLKGAGTFTGSDPDTTALMSTLTGTAVLALAGLSLPALLRFVSPMAAAGSGAISGAAIGAATVAVGAAVVTRGAGGGARGASAAAGAGAGGSSAGGAGAAAGGGAGTDLAASAGGTTTGSGAGTDPGGDTSGGVTGAPGGGPSNGPGAGPGGGPSGGAGGGQEAGTPAAAPSGGGASGAGPGSAAGGSTGSSAPAGTGGGPASGSGSSSGSRWNRAPQALAAAGSYLQRAMTNSIDQSPPSGPSGATPTQSGS
jgi:type IV secretion system protein TrbL